MSEVTRRKLLQAMVATGCVAWARPQVHVLGQVSPAQVSPAPVAVAPEQVERPTQVEVLPSQQDRPEPKVVAQQLERQPAAELPVTGAPGLGTAAAAGGAALAGGWMLRRKAEKHDEAP